MVTWYANAILRNIGFGCCRGSSQGFDVQQRSLGQYLAQRIPITAIVTVFFFYPSLVRLAIGMFACISVDNQLSIDRLLDTLGTDRSIDITFDTIGMENIGSYWVFSMEQQCWSGWHTPWALGLGIPLLLLLFVVVPALIFWLHMGPHALPG